MNILIVDDQPTDLKLLRAQLEAEGHVVVEAHDGVDALALLERQRVDAVISDILMPRMDGYRLCHEIRKHTRLRDLPVIIYTATYTSPGDEKLALDMGADKYLKKPLSVEILVVALHEVIAQPHAAPRADALREIVVLKEYNERLVSKLLKKNTELHAQTEALRASERKFQSVFEQAAVGVIIIKGSRGQFVNVNRRFCEMVGYSAEELLQLTSHDITHPDDIATDTGQLEQINFGIIREFSREKRYRRKDGSFVWAKTFIAPLDPTEAKPPLRIGVIVDITERKRAEEQMNLQFSALTAAANTIVITDRDGKIEWVNPAFTKLTGYSADEAIGRTPRILKSGRHPPEFYSNMWQTILAGNVWHGELVNKRKDGNSYTEDMTITPVRGADGQIAHFVSIRQDITERRLLEDQLRQTQKMEAIGQLASGVAHDFNNILAIIQLQAGLLKAEQSLSPEQLDFAGEIEKSAQRAADLTRQLLLFSRKQALQPRDLDLNEVVTSITKMLRRVLGEDVQMQFKFSPQPLLVHADAGMVDQILMNLTINARDAMPKGGTLTIRTDPVTINDAYVQSHPQARLGAFVCLRVTDTGCGMDAATMGRIFEPFFTTKEVGKGTGLGLATVYGIVKQHEGWIEVSSEVGKGSAFNVFLPATSAPVTASAPISPLTAAVRGGQETILVVEDEPVLRDMAHLILQDCGYHVLEADSGAEALRVWERNSDAIDLVLTDMVMPGGVSGRDLATRLLANHPELKVIFTSGYNIEEANTDFFRRRGAVFLRKPYTRVDLAKVVRESLDK